LYDIIIAEQTYTPRDIAVLTELSNTRYRRLSGVAIAGICAPASLLFVELSSQDVRGLANGPDIFKYVSLGLDVIVAVVAAATALTGYFYSRAQARKEVKIKATHNYETLQDKLTAQGLAGPVT